MNSKIKIIPTPCPICHYSIGVPFFNGGQQPLATLGWPNSSPEAQAMPRYPHNYIQCPKCTHVWNRSFSYDAIPYNENPNRMFNKGGHWKGHLADTRNLVLSHLPDSPTVVDIGCGEGHFVRGISEALERHGRFAGFDPNTTGETGHGLEFYPRYFEPLTDMTNFNPDTIVIRHVLEHLTQPTAFLEQLAWGASKLNKSAWLFAEVPCIDRVFETKRLADFFYEHPSQFTTESFRTLMESAGEIVKLAHGYNGEVVFALVHLKLPVNRLDQADTATLFNQTAEISRKTIRTQLDEIAQNKVAIWGGTGKAAAFIHQFNVDAKRFPLVVDSDLEKVGSFVPGTGQEIVFRDKLKSSAIDIIIIPTQWRAKDIVAEMKRENISVEQILIEHNGRLINFLTDKNPYTR